MFKYVRVCVCVSCECLYAMMSFYVAKAGGGGEN